MLGLLERRQGEQEGSGTSSCLLLGNHIETRSGRKIESQRAEAWGGGVVGREEVKPILSFPYVCFPLVSCCW